MRKPGGNQRISKIYTVRNSAPLGFEPFDSAIRQAHGGESNRTAHGSECGEGSERLEFLTRLSELHPDKKGATLSGLPLF